MSESYSVVLTGEIADGYGVEEVKTTIGKLFKLSDGKVEKLFAGRPVAIRRGIDKGQALKLRSVLTKAGAVAAIKVARSAVETKADDGVLEQRQSSMKKVEQQAVAATVACPRCGHEQPRANACSLCKMNLELHLLRMERKEKVRILRQQSS